MADRFNKSDTMDLTNMMQKAAPRLNTPAAPDTGADGYVYSGDEGTNGDDFDAPRGTAGRSEKPLIITLVIVGILVIAGVIGFALSRSGDSGTSGTASPTQPAADVADHVIVSGINVGGMSYEAALKALSAAEQKLADEIRIEVVCGEKTMTLTKDDFVLRFNTEEILRQAQQNPRGSYEISMTVEESSYPAIEKAVADAVDQEGEDARVVSFNTDKSEMFTYQEAVSGKKLNREDLTAQLRNLISGGSLTGTISAQCEETKPEITADYLKQNIKKLSSFTTESTNTANAMSNQALSLSACNSSIIEPGATWSFNACTGDTNLESRGYLPAGVIVQGRHEIGIGGGICQSSTTIYNAGLLCGMEVVERYEHYYPSSYVDYGRDATIDYGNLDLKLRNPFTYQLFLKCWMDGVILHAEIYGLPSKDFDQIKVTTAAPVYTKTSYTVKAYRTYYLNGKSVRTEELPISTYYFSAPGETEAPTTAPTTAPTQPPTVTPTVPTETPTEAPPTPTGEPGTEPVAPPTDDPGPAPVDEPDDPSGDPSQAEP